MSCNDTQLITNKGQVQERDQSKDQDHNSNNHNKDNKCHSPNSLCNVKLEPAVEFEISHQIQNNDIISSVSNCLLDKQLSGVLASTVNSRFNEEHHNNFNDELKTRYYDEFSHIHNNHSNMYLNNEQVMDYCCLKTGNASNSYYCNPNNACKIQSINTCMCSQFNFQATNCNCSSCAFDSRLSYVNHCTHSCCCCCRKKYYGCNFPTTYGSEQCYNGSYINPKDSVPICEANIPRPSHQTDEQINEIVNKRLEERCNHLVYEISNLSSELKPTQIETTQENQLMHQNINYCNEKNNNQRFNFYGEHKMTQCAQFDQYNSESLPMPTLCTISNNQIVSNKSQTKPNSNNKKKSNCNKLCTYEGCLRHARLYNKCTKHGGALRCVESGCRSLARDLATKRCFKHGGGPRCRFEGCKTSARSKNRFYCQKHATIFSKNENK